MNILCGNFSNAATILYPGVTDLKRRHQEEVEAGRSDEQENNRISLKRDHIVKIMALQAGIL